VILAEGCDDYIRKPFRENDLFDALVKHLQVKFTYEELEQPAVSLAQRPAVGKLEPMQISSRLAKLSPELLRGLRQATMLGYWDRVQVYIGQVHEQDPELGMLLTELARNYDQNRILQSIDAI